MEIVRGRCGRRGLAALRRGLGLLALAVMGAMLVGGCMSTGPAEQSDRELQPWNQPAGWEDRKSVV